MLMQFGGVDNKMTSFEKAKVAVLPVPYGRTVDYKKGTEKGPLAILDASDNMELFDEELGKEVHTIGINTQKLLKVKGLRPEKMISVVENKVSDILKRNKMPITLGGEHSVTIGAVRALKKHYKNLSILYFDAHYDLRDTYRGSKYNHACVARRLVEMANVVEVGVRSLSKEEKDFLSRNNIRIVNMRDLRKKANWPNIVKGYLSKNVYISIDLDVFDTSIMMSVGTPEPGGMAWGEFLEAIRSIIVNKRIVGFDVVELCPIKNNVAPDFMAAKLIYKMLGYIFFKR